MGPAARACSLGFHGLLFPVLSIGLRRGLGSQPRTRAGAGAASGARALAMQTSSTIPSTIALSWPASQSTGRLCRDA
jgi:hypothetical protein